MLAQGIPRDTVASESDMRRAMSMGMDFSPSQLVIDPAQSLPRELQSLVEAQGRTGSSSMQTSPYNQQLFLQPLIPSELGNSTIPMQGTPAQTSNFSALPGSSSGHAVNPGVLRPPTVNGVMNVIPVSATNPSSSRASSASSESRPHVTSFSRRPDSIGGSPKNVPTDAVSFGRLNQARQRTAQACEKCRDRKTKCSGTKPICRRCSDRGLTCVWAPDTRIRGPAKQPRQTKLGSGDNTGDPLSILPVPLLEPQSGDSSPSFHGDNPANSAPAFQTTFPAISLPSHLVRRDQQKRQSWHESAFCPGGVAKGINAHNIMGEPIRPITSVDDCWYSVENAEVETRGRDRSATIRPRERRNSVSVAHLARARDRDETLSLPATQVPEQPDLHGGLHPTSPEAPGSEPSLSLTSSRNSSSFDHDLCQPHPSYDLGSRLSEEMMKLLNFPGACEIPANENGLFNGIETVSDPAFNYPDASKFYAEPTSMFEPSVKEGADEVFAQYFDTDAFNRMQT